MKKVDWPKHFKLRGGLDATYLGRCGATGRHRVRTDNISGYPGTTTWLLDDFGRCNVRGEESQLDYLP